MNLNTHYNKQGIDINNGDVIILLFSYKVIIMNQKLRKTYLFIMVLGFIFISIISIFISSGLSLPSIHTSNNDDFSFSGDYEGGISIMYNEQTSNFSSWFDTNSSTNLIPHNYSVLEHEFQLNRMEIFADHLINESESGEFIIANNVSQLIDLTPAFGFSQEFTSPDLISIEEITIYLNYTLGFLPKAGQFYFLLIIFDENFETRMDTIWHYESGKPRDEWVSFYPHSNIFGANQKFNLILNIWSDGGDFDFPIDYWKAEKYEKWGLNKGLTRRFNGESWSLVNNDSYVDMLCNFTYEKLIDPAEVDLKFKINNEIVTPIYQPSSWGFHGYEAYYSYILEAPTNQSTNITVTTNQTIPSLDVYIDIYYIYLINASGIYNASENHIKWVIEYEYEDISFGWPPTVFLFERDWQFEKFTDPNNQELSQIYFGPVDLYSNSYYGITSIFGPPLERGTYVGEFSSPNYCHKINTKVKQGNDFIVKPSVELGQTIKLEAEIYNLFNEPISGGTGQILLFSPSGELKINDTSLTAINGTMSSSEINLNSTYKVGTYEAKIFWTDGREAAVYTITFVVEVLQGPINIFFWVMLSIGLALASTPIALVTRKYIRQRNWEKSLKNLFVFTKEGLSLYQYSFGIEIQDPALISAMISALTNFVREATGSKKALRTVDQEDKKVILNHGTYTTIAVMSDKDLPIIHKRITKFTEAFESQFGLKLKQWRGETTMFKETDVIVNKYFPIDVEGQIIRGVRGKLVEFRSKLEVMDKPRETISLMKEITEFISRYRGIVNKYYIDYYFEIIKIAEEKIFSA